MDSKQTTSPVVILKDAELAESADGRLSKHEGIAATVRVVNSDGSITHVDTQYNSGGADPELLAECRAFGNAVHYAREAAYQERQAREWTTLKSAIDARKVAESSAFARAQAEGQPVYLRTVGCDGSDPDCSIDVLYAMPDGSTNRVHQG